MFRINDSFQTFFSVEKCVLVSYRNYFSSVVRMLGCVYNGPDATERNEHESARDVRIRSGSLLGGIYRSVSFDADRPLERSDRV